tara:strand:+ start:653 stop:940 length:288 start_codon:yes stop_codon:yes gene_type:complete
VKKSYSADKRSIVVRLAKRRATDSIIGKGMRKIRKQSRLTTSKPTSYPRESIKYIVLLAQMVASTLVLPTLSQHIDLGATLTRIESIRPNSHTLA